jgi:hypothetical protein
VELEEGRDLVERLRFVEWMFPSWLVEGDLGPRKQANRYVPVGCITEADRAGAEIARFELVTDLRRPGFYVASNAKQMLSQTRLGGVWTYQQKAFRGADIGESAI